MAIADYIINNNFGIEVQSSISPYHIFLQFDTWPYNVLNILNHSSYQPTCNKMHYNHEDDHRKAITALNSLQTSQCSLTDLGFRQYPVRNKTRVIDYLSICGLEVPDIEKTLSIIHVSGTKGKGSTCAYCESILRLHGFKTGFFSSPHLVSVRERLRINGNPITWKKFSGYFWEVYQKLRDDPSISCGNLPMPFYFMFMTVLAFKVFIEEKVDVAIMEVGIGGEYDCTNILSNTAVVGISSLGFDHVHLLGNTIEEIAWHKAGILKQGSIAIVSGEQPKKALEVLRQRAVEKKCAIFEAPPLDDLLCVKEIKLGINGPVQSLNASLAIQLVNAWMNPQCYTGEIGSILKSPTFSATDKIVEALELCQWSGRTQTLIYSPRITYYLDGAHTLESIQHTADWFIPLRSSECKKVIVFNTTGNRNAKDFLNILNHCKFDYAIFCPNRIEREMDSSSDNWLPNSFDIEKEQTVEINYKTWLEINPSFDRTNSMIFPSVTEVHKFLESLSERHNLQVLVTGSLHLVGAVLSIVDPDIY